MRWGTAVARVMCVACVCAAAPAGAVGSDEGAR
jgi:hypothetical protein